jgi:DNA-binding NarL/FixJ family response regulator
MNKTPEPRQERVGIAGFPTLLLGASLINPSDLALAQQHASREKIPLVDAVVALGLLERENFDVLEAANGKEAIGRLRRDMTMATLPIMVLTSEEGPGVERRVLDLGADDYILKPFDPAVLLSRVNGVFRRLKVMAA